MNKRLSLKLYSIESCPNFDFLAQEFDSTNEQIDEFLRKKCLKYSKENRLQTFIVVDSTANIMVGFFSSTVGTLSQSIKKDDGSEAITLPFVNLAYFAINKEYQKKGIGRALMMQFFSMCMVISQYTGISLIYLESVADSVNFYKKLGYQLKDERKSPELYKEFQKINKIDLDTISFPMLMRISKVEENGYKAYYKNALPIEFES